MKKLEADVLERSMTDEERTYFSNKLQKAEAFDDAHKETYSLDDIINNIERNMEFNYQIIYTAQFESDLDNIANYFCNTLWMTISFVKRVNLKMLLKKYSKLF